MVTSIKNRYQRTRNQRSEFVVNHALIFLAYSETTKKILLGDGSLNHTSGHIEVLSRTMQLKISMGWRSIPLGSILLVWLEYAYPYNEGYRRFGEIL